MWCDPDDVLALTGETVTTGNCAIASSMIETYTEVFAEDTDNADRYLATDLRTIRRAASWQAPWVRDHPGLLTERESAKDVSADSTRVSREARSDIMLAPMAARELENLSWVRTHSVRVLDARDTARPAMLDFLRS
jgi:hypothetical protein